MIWFSFFSPILVTETRRRKLHSPHFAQEEEEEEEEEEEPKQTHTCHNCDEQNSCGTLNSTDNNGKKRTQKRRSENRVTFTSSVLLQTLCI